MQTAISLKPAPVHLRLAAFLFDVVLLVSGTLSVGYLTQIFFPLPFVVYGLMFGLSGVYFIGYAGVRGATPGKRLLGLRIRDADGHPIEQDRAVLRYLAYLICFLLFPFGTIANVALVLTDAQRRSLPDRLVGTLVLDERLRRRGPRLVSEQSCAQSADC